MVKQIFKSLLLSVLIAIFFGIHFGFTFGAYMGLQSNPTLMLIMILPIFLYTWLTTKIQNKIASTMSFMYWLLCFVASLIVLIVGLGHFGKETINWLDYFFLHLALMFLLVPEMDGYWTTYLNTEVTLTYNDGFVDVSERKWISKEYTAGTFVKMMTMAGIGLVMGLLTIMGDVGIWIAFVLEAIYTLALTGINLKLFLSN